MLGGAIPRGAIGQKKMNADKASGAIRTTAGRERLAGIDALRCLLAFSVVLVHTIFESGARAAHWSEYIVTACRFGMPCFFIAGGYLLPRRQRSNWEIFSKPVVRLSSLYLIWMTVYYIFLNLDPRHRRPFVLNQFFSDWPIYHLWFLPVLATALVMVPLGLKYLGAALTTGLCAILALLALATSTYHDILHLPGIAQHGRLLAAPMFVCIGAMLARKAPRLSARTNLLLVAVFFLAMVGEEALIQHLSGAGHVMSHEFLFSSFLFGPGVFLLWRPLSHLRFTPYLARVGRLSPNIYMSHLIFIWLAVSLARHPALPWALVLAPLAFLGAALLSMALEWLLPRLKSHGGHYLAARP